MKIALCTPYLTKCGVASYSFYLADALAKQGCDVYVVRLNRFGVKDDTYYRHFAEEVPLEQVDLISCQHEYGLYSWSELAFYTALKNRMELLGKKVPVVTTLHSTGNLKVDRTIHTYNDAVIVHNTHQANEYKFPCYIIPMGVQKVKESPHPDLAKRRWGVTGKTVGMFGFVSEYKGLETLIRALAKLSDVTLLVGGGWHIDTETPYITSIKIYAEQLMPRRIRFLGYIQEEDMPNYFGACDIMVYAHHFISESMALTTALAYGKAVLTSRQPAFIEKEQEGVAMTFQDAEDLTGKIKALLSEPELRSLMEENAKKYSIANSWENSAINHIKLFESLITVGDKQK